MRLACFALVKGADDYNGPDESAVKKGKKKAKDIASDGRKGKATDDKGKPESTKAAKDKAKGKHKSRKKD